ncbi:MAG: hypothetical protein VKM98_09090 [Cyanobacteriota bacterium]|nr:hypothetical protein [Cyanobacteriota bacterium]
MSTEPQLPLQLQALLNRLQARFGSGVADVAASLLAAAEAAPARASREWQLFWQEVELEAERLAGGDSENPQAATGTSVDSVRTDSVRTDSFRTTAPSPSSSDPQTLIDGLRAKVATLSHRLDA